MTKQELRNKYLKLLKKEKEFLLAYKNKKANKKFLTEINEGLKTENENNKTL